MQTDPAAVDPSFGAAVGQGVETAIGSSRSAEFKRWQWRILLSALVGYALFYFVRKNLSVAMPVMETTLGIRKSQLGLFLTLHGLVYGLSKFLNGIAGDRLNARWFMVTGLVFCAVINIWFGFSS